ncbi:hypothetical protein ACK35A_20000 [Aeromonas veronii]
MLKSMLSKLAGVKRSLPNINIVEPKTVIRITWVVGKLNTPTMDFYFRSRPAMLAGFNEVDIDELNDVSHPFWASQDDRVVLVRDVPIRLLRKLKCGHARRHIIWFIDDDIPAVVDDMTLPSAYRKRLSSWFNQAYCILGQICNDIWVSTPYLAERYNLPSRSILPPRQIMGMEAVTVKCFYHGSASHTQEWDFVIKLIEKIQEKYEYVWFELIGDHSLYKRIRHVPRVTVLHPMSWANYQAHIASRKMDIGLAPLFCSPFNAARSHCKLLDIQRQGAIGIYSTGFPYSTEIKGMAAGIIAGDSLDSWLDAFERALHSDRKIIHANSVGVINKSVNECIL